MCRLPLLRIIKQNSEFIQSIPLNTVLMKPSLQNTYSLGEYFRKKQNLNLNSKLQQYFSILEKISSNETNLPPSTVISDQMMKAFESLSDSQQKRYLIENMEYISKAINNRVSKRNSLDSNFQQAFNESKSIETTCEVGKKHILYCFRVLSNIVLDKNKKILILENKKKQNRVYNLRHFLVRRSKNSKQTVILEPAIPSTQLDDQYKSQKFIFSSSIADRIYEEIWSCVMSFRNEELLFLLSSQDHEKHHEKHGRVFLNHKNFKSLMKFKEKAIEEAKNHVDKWVTLYQKKRTNGESYMVLQSRIKDQHIKLEAILQKSAKNIKKQFMEMMQEPKTKCSFVEESSVLEEYQEIYQAVYQKLQIHGRNFQLIFIKDTYPTKNTLSNNSKKEEDILFLKGIQNILVINFLEFMLVTVTPITEKISKLTIYCSFNLNHIINSKLAKIYLLGLINQNKESEIHKEIKNEKKQNDDVINSATQLCKQVNTSGDSSIVSNEHEIFFDFGDPEEGCDEFYSIANDDFVSSESMSEINQNQNKLTDKTDKTTAPKKIQEDHPQRNSSVKHFYRLTPIEGYDIMANLQKDHFLFKDWKRRKNGGVTCINQELVEKQKKLFKEVITSMGSQILKGGNILNVSLPVTIFKQESHIQILAKNMMYAPLLLENRKDYLERLKYSVLFAISFGTTGISLDKPFFTFLGETVQYWIGGCPAYVQQITRYPPVSQYLFIGRGYRVHGQVDPKINFGVNGVKGYSQRPIFIQFDDGTVIEFVCGKMVISGLLIGERQFNFYDKIYIYDKTHNMFAELNFGARKKHIFQKNQQPSDFYYGSIYEVMPEFLNIFQKQIPRQYPTKKHIVRELSTFEGIWSEKAYFDSKEYFDFRSQHPCAATLDENPLPSDSSFRPQLIKLIQGNIEESQRLKIIAEQEQRRDRRLRKSYENKQG